MANKKRADTWMPLYIGDYLADTGRLTTEGHGAYLLLIMDYWRNGAPPDDDDTLAAITKLPVARWKKLRPVMASLFIPSDGLWHHKRIDAELAKATEISASRGNSGKAGANARWGKKDSSAVASAMANAIAKASQTDAPSQSPTQSQQEVKPQQPIPEPVHEAAATGQEGRGAAGRIADLFEQLRDELWPGNPNFPAPSLTLQAQAQAWLNQGAPEALLAEVLRREMGREQSKGMPAPGSLDGFKFSLQRAVAQHRNSGQVTVGSTAAAAQEQRLARIEEYTPAAWRGIVRLWIERHACSRAGWAVLVPQGWPHPGSEGCPVPDAILDEFTEQLIQHGLTRSEA